MNIPVPPIILYETDYNAYEVIDGQQRITAISDFYDNKLQLEGLEIWEELNGRNSQELPSRIQAGIDRRSLSSIVLITESTSNPEEAMFLKQQAFERINTGGVSLSKQEVRNCLFSGNFNNLLIELAKNQIFAKAWGIPKESQKQTENPLYKKMEDVELVLRFFALRDMDNFKYGITKHLDKYMRESGKLTSEDREELKDIFLRTIDGGYQIYGDNLFKPFNLKLNKWMTKAYKAYYDAVMVGLSNHYKRYRYFNCSENNSD